jgi:hypothetical protein
MGPLKAMPANQKTTAIGEFRGRRSRLPRERGTTHHIASTRLRM